MPYIDSVHFNPDKHHARIICTLGPSSSRKNIIKLMAQSGMKVARLNFSHGSHPEHQKLINIVRELNKDHGMDIEILQDLAGYRIRIGILESPITLKEKDILTLSNDPQYKDKHIPLDSDFDISTLKNDMMIYIADGMIALKVKAVYDNRVKARVIAGGKLKSRKGVNIPDLRLRSNILTEKDQKDIEFGIKNKVDFIAQSFVRNQKDIERINELVKPELPDCRIIAKIENKQGVRNIDKIIDACDGILVARGDLGVSLPIYKIPVIQKDIIRRCNNREKIVVTATQMLESMTESPRPTRAEVSDVANAIFDGTDYVMLSGETAIGRFPVRSVRMMAHVVDFTEKFLRKG